MSCTGYNTKVRGLKDRDLPVYANLSLTIIIIKLIFLTWKGKVTLKVKKKMDQFL